MAEKVARVKGMYDVLPEAAARFDTVFAAARDLLTGYGYGRIRTPLLERLELFVGAIGEDTDVVGKEMYAFEDRGGAWLALRPEGTAGCVRAMIDGGLLSPGQSHRVWYRGPMFRRENVQRGRSRQFHQIGAEAFGLSGPDIDVEMIALLGRLWGRLGLGDIALQINTLGTENSRATYRSALVEYLQARRSELDDDSARRLETNPLRVLDSKNPAMAHIVADAPSGLDYLDAESEAHFAQLCELLDALNIEYEVNPRLVRGLDYYTKTVFEWVTMQLGAQGTVCGGGRYDGLVRRQGGGDVPAVGFSIGVERIVALMEAGESASESMTPDAYFVLVGDGTTTAGIALAESLRESHPHLRLTTNAGGGSFKAQFKRADRSGARYAVVLGAAELADGSVQLKDLRVADAEQRRVPQNELGAELTSPRP